MGVGPSGHDCYGNAEASEHTFIASFICFIMACVFIIRLRPHSVSLARERHLHRMNTHLVTYARITMLTLMAVLGGSAPQRHALGRVACTL